MLCKVRVNILNRGNEADKTDWLYWLNHVTPTHVSFFDLLYTNRSRQDWIRERFIRSILVTPACLSENILSNLHGKIIVV